MRGKIRRPRLPLGPVSEGTMLDADLFVAFTDAADSIKMSKKDRAIVNEMLTHEHDLQDFESEECLAEDVAVLFDLLNNYVPDHCYFGAHEGDGACYGIWPSSDVPFHGPATDEIGKGDCLPSARVVRQDYWLKVNDHGNATLYRKRRRGKAWDWTEVWSVV